MSLPYENKKGIRKWKVEMNRTKEQAQDEEKCIIITRQPKIWRKAVSLSDIIHMTGQTALWQVTHSALTDRQWNVSK
jgi:hypothetical protein